MRIRLAILALSIAANLIFARILTRPVAQDSTPPAPARARSDTVRIQNHHKPDGAGLEENAAQVAPAFCWVQLESTDFPQYISRLRAFGVPERIIRDIIMAEVEKIYRPKLAPLRTASSRTNFWEQRNNFGPWPGTTKEQREQLRALQKEQKELTQSLLGKDVFNESAKDSPAGNWTERMYAPVPTELRDKVAEMAEHYQEARSEVYASAQGMMDEDSQADLKRLERKFREELRTVLTPEQAREYEMRNSDTANSLKWELGGFEPNEAEYRAIFDYKRALEDLNSPRTPSDASPKLSTQDGQDRERTTQDIETALEDAIGADRVKEYKLLEKWEYRNLVESGVSKDSVFQIEDLKTKAEDAARKIRGDSSLAAEERAMALGGIRDETEAALTELIGQRRAKAFANNGGFWLRNIAPHN